jgi:hypothetical protein
MPFLLKHMDSQINKRCNAFAIHLKTVLGLAAALSVAANVQAESPVVWSRGITADAANYSSYEFRLYAINQDRLHLDGTWLYKNYAISHSGLPSFEIAKDDVGILWPKVKLEVQNIKTGQWVPIGKSLAQGKKTTLAIPPDSNFDLFVNLDPFKPYLHKYKLGRVILTNGQASQFSLKSLLPPERPETTK